MEENSEINSAWLREMSEGREDALAALMTHYYETLYNYAIKFSDDGEQVKDTIQEVFISLWQRRDRAREILSLKFYLLRAVKNKMLKSLQQKSRSKMLEEQAAYPFRIEFSIENKIIEQQISAETAHALRQLLARLPERQKEVIYLKFYLQMDNGQVAELMNINRQSVYNLLHESLRNLRACWQQQIHLKDVSVGRILSLLF